MTSGEGDAMEAGMTDETMVERVARAVFKAEGRICSQSGDPWDDLLNDYTRGPYLRQARAAIEAMRLDPSLQSEACPPDIVDAGRNEIMAWDLGPNDFKKANAATVDCFNAMIDAALK